MYRTSTSIVYQGHNGCGDMHSNNNEQSCTDLSVAQRNANTSIVEGQFDDADEFDLPRPAVNTSYDILNPIHVLASAATSFTPRVKPEAPPAPRVKAKRFSASAPTPSPASEKSSSGMVRDTEITSSDVLCGRGGMVNNHVGNRCYRAMVQSLRDQYILAKDSQKIEISRAVVAAIRSGTSLPGGVGGRFLKRDKEKNLWFDIGDKKAAEKTSQTFREGLAERRMRVLARLNETTSNST